MVGRHKPYKTLIKNEDLDGHYDSAGEEFIFKMYLESHGEEANVENIEKLSVHLSGVLCGTDREEVPNISLQSLHEDPLLLKRKFTKK